MSLSLELFVRKRLTFQDLNNKIQLPIQNYINEKCVIQDEVSEDIAAYKIVRRDAQGRVKFAAPGAPEHGARKAEVDDVRNYVKSIYHVSLPLGTHWGNTIEPRKRTTIWHVPWKIPTGKTLYLDRAAYHFNNSPHLRLHIRSYRSTPSQVLWSSPNASDDIWAGFPLIPPQPTDYITVEIYNSSSEYTQSFDNTSGIWLQFGIA